MSRVKEKIRKQIDYILSSDKEENLYALSDILTVWQQEDKGWGNTSEEEKEHIRKTFDEMSLPENQVSNEQMMKFFDRWEEKLSGQNG